VFASWPGGFNLDAVYGHKVHGSLTTHCMLMWPVLGDLAARQRGNVVQGVCKGFAKKTSVKKCDC